MRRNHVFATHDFYQKLSNYNYFSWSAKNLEYFIPDTVYLLTTESEAGDC